MQSGRERNTSATRTTDPSGKEKEGRSIVEVAKRSRELLAHHTQSRVARRNPKLKSEKIRRKGGVRAEVQQVEGTKKTHPIRT